MDLRMQVEEISERLLEKEAPLEVFMASVVSRQKVEKALKLLRENPQMTVEEYLEKMEIDL